MAVKLKANVQYINAIETIQRKFVPKKVKLVGPDAAQAGPVILAMNDGFMGGAQRLSWRAGYGQCSRNYLFIKTEGRSSAISSHELDLRTYFSKAVKGRNTIIKDLSQVSRVQAMWLEAREVLTKTINGVSAKGYTLSGWIMAVQYAGIYNDPQTYNANTFPQAFDGE